MNKLILCLLGMFIIISANNILYAWEKPTDEKMLDKEIEKNIFIATGIQDRVLKIGLVDCMTYALKNNSDIQIKRIEPRLRNDDVKIAWSRFEPELTGEFNIHDKTSTSIYSSFFTPPHAKSRTNTFNVGLDGKLVTGTKYEVDFFNSKNRNNNVSTFEVINPYYSSQPQVTITQPLFRGFGIAVNKADITIARNTKKQSDESFKDTVMTIITNTKIAYYSYIYHLKNYALAVSTWERAKDLYDINKLRYAKGLVSSVDLLETEADSISKEKLVIAAESNLKKAEDDLKLITNLVNDPAVWNARIELLDKLEFKIYKTELLGSLKEAFSNRPDYKVAKLELKNKDVRILTAKNDLLPTVDFVGSLGLNGLADTYANTIDDISTKHKDWAIGVKVTLPFGGEERANMDKKNQEKIQSLIAFRDLEQKIILEIRDKVRQVNTQKQQVDASERFMEKEKENYEAQKERYAAGQVSTHDMIDYQDRLAASELGYNVALIDYNSALFELEKSEGITLIKNDIKLEER